MLYQAPDHLRYKIFAAPLSPELRTSHGAKTLPVRSGDSVRIMRGDHKGVEGKITGVDRKKYRIYVEGLTREKVDGTTIFIPIHPSKVMITRLNIDDKWRKKILERKKAALRKAEEVEEKPPKEVAAPKEAVEEKPAEKKPRRRKRRAVTKQPIAKKKKEEAKEAKKETKPKAKARTRTRAKSKTVKKNQEGM
jgi:large subunit ribosomal protein L24